MSEPFRKSKRTPRTPPLSPSPSPTPPKTPSSLQVKSVAEQKSEKKKKEEKKKMDAQLKALVKQREAVCRKLLRVCDSLKGSEEEPNPNVRNVYFLQLQVSAMERIYGECNEVQNKIYALLLSEEQDKVQNEKYVEFESIFNEVSLKLSTLIEVVPKAEPAAAPAVEQPAQPYLPPLQVPLPKFDGSYEKWYKFKALFTTVMNSYQQEEPAMKLYHLRNSLVGEAEGIIDDEMINTNDYDAAWELLKRRFEDKRIVVDKLVEKLFRLPKVSKKDAGKLRKTIDTCAKNVEALKKQELPGPGLGEQMLVNLIVGKMDENFQAAWEAKQKKNELATYAALLAFLEEQHRIAEKLDTKAKAVRESVTLLSDQRCGSDDSGRENESSTSDEDEKEEEND